jgi:hypothetical protein
MLLEAMTAKRLDCRLDLAIAELRALSILPR